MIYTIDGQTFDKLPDPFRGRSPMTDAAFSEMGGTITKGPRENFLEGLDAYLDELEKEAREKYALDVTKAEFKQSAATMLSDDLIKWAKSKGVPDAMIEVVRGAIVTKVADASRLGMTWSDIFPKPSK